MKRYRVLGFDFDSRAIALRPSEPDWEKPVRESHEKNRQRIISGILAEFGTLRGSEKLANFTDLGPKPFSVVAFHNRFLTQTRHSFVISAYYPALTSAAALGERILNHLILRLREDFKGSPEYKEVYRKESFDDWEKAVRTLESWGVILPEAAVGFRSLADVRNKALHFNPETDTDDRELAKNAISLLEGVITAQFSAFGIQPWFIPGIAGASYIKKEAERWPFVREIYLPNSALVGPRHHLEIVEHRFVVHDDEVYEDREVSDEDFRDLLERKGQ